MAQDKEHLWEKELQSAVRSLTRALIFGIALLYTMEIWWIGTYLDYRKLIVFFILAFCVSLYLIPVTASDSSSLTLWQIVQTATRNKGIAVLAALFLLWLFGRISPLSAPVERDIATIMLLSIPIEFGSNVGRILQVYTSRGPTASKQKQQSGSKQEQSGGGKEQEGQSGQSERRRPWLFILKVAGATSGGAMFVALPLAPTMEIPLLATRLNYWQELGIIALSLLISYMIIYTTGMTRSAPSGQGGPGSQIWPYADTLFSYGIALFASALMLYLFGRIQMFTALDHIISLIVVLGLPATIGGAAGKLAL